MSERKSLVPCSPWWPEDEELGHVEGGEEAAMAITKAAWILELVVGECWQGGREIREAAAAAAEEALSPSGGDGHRCLMAEVESGLTLGKVIDLRGF